MKKIILYIFIAIAGLVTIQLSCSKSISGRTDKLPPLTPAKLDLNAGTWKTVVLTSANEFPLAAPSATNTPDYIAQINEIKAFQDNITDEEKALVEYWSAGAVLRWNEIMRELVAKRNLPPYQNPDGTYPAPQANNPLAYPFFPFANPPYASRAYAYVSVAQYDALVAAWHYKTLYNRVAPYKVDQTLNVMIPKNDLPSYPSEDAVIAGVTVEMLKLLFPGDQDVIQLKAEQHKRARIISGANVRSDIDAGESLGKAIAQKIVARARADRAGTAGGTPAVWAQMEQNCIARGEVPWYSLEVPKRPPMLPLFGAVRAFLFDSLSMVTQIRPAAPPSTGSPKFKDETDEVKYYVDNPTRERTRIVHFWADGAGTSTPSGHWNLIATEDFIKQNYSEVRWARNMALLNMTLMDAAIACWDAKYFYYNPRPTQTDPSIKTLTGIPNFPAFISGHSTFSGSAAAILGYIVPSRASDYDAMATEASMSRLYGGIHYRADCELGLTTGKKVGAFAVSRAKTDGADN